MSKAVPAGGGRFWKVCLLTAGVCSGSMALYHYWLPFQYGWVKDIKPSAPNVAWGALMVNACFSTLLLFGAALTVQSAYRWSKRDELTTTCVAGMGLFWLFNATYQLMVPMPLPARLAFLRWVLVGFAAFVALLHGAALTASRKGS